MKLTSTIPATHYSALAIKSRPISFGRGMVSDSEATHEADACIPLSKSSVCTTAESSLLLRSVTRRSSCSNQQTELVMLIARSDRTDPTPSLTGGSSASLLPSQKPVFTSPTTLSSHPAAALRITGIIRAASSRTRSRKQSDMRRVGGREEALYEYASVADQST